MPNSDQIVEQNSSGSKLILLTTVGKCYSWLIRGTG
jgi:hypothetical protein